MSIWMSNKKRVIDAEDGLRPRDSRPQEGQASAIDAGVGNADGCDCEYPPGVAGEL